MIGLVDESKDGGLQFRYGTEHAALEAAPGELGEEALDGIEPGWHCHVNRKFADSTTIPVPFTLRLSLGATLA